MKVKKSFVFYLVIFFCICGIGLVFIFGFKGNDKIQEGIYKMEKLESNISYISYITLRTDKTFHFIPYMVSSYSISGDYSVENDILTLHSQSGDYEFYIKNNKIIFKGANNLIDCGGASLSDWRIDPGSEFVKAEEYFDEDIE